MDTPKTILGYLTKDYHLKVLIQKHFYFGSKNLCGMEKFIGFLGFFIKIRTKNGKYDKIKLSRNLSKQIRVHLINFLQFNNFIIFFLQNRSVIQN